MMWIAVALPAFWVFGAHINDVARALVGVLLVVGVAKRRTILNARVEPTKRQISLLAAFVVAFVVFTATQPILETWLGRHGIDFAIFTQVVDSIARRGGPYTSLIEMDWRNFLSHHFVPFLYLPGAMAVAGVPPFVAISLTHAACVGFSGLALWLTSRRLGYGPGFCWVAVALLFANPTFRHGVFFGVHDELFALPFLGFAFLTWLSGRPWLAALCLVGAMVTKESMFMVAATFGLMMVFYQPVGKNRTVGLVLAAAGLFGFVAYAFLQPLVLGKSFDHVSKLASFDELLRLDWLGGKLLFLGFLGLPFLMLPLWRRRTWALILPALPLVGLVLVSRFEEMWSLMNYYGVVPTYILAFASLIALRRTELGRECFPFPAFAVAFLMTLAFCWSGKKPAKVLLEAYEGPRLDATELAPIPDDAKVIANPSAALYLFRASVVWRTWLANLKPPSDYDLIVTMPSEISEIGAALRDGSYVCFESSSWQIRCRRGGRFDLRR